MISFLVNLLKLYHLLNTAFIVLSTQYFGLILEIVSSAYDFD